MRQDLRRLAIVCAVGAIMVGGAAALPDNSVLRNTSQSMDLGWYVMVPFAEPKAGDVVAFPIPPQARDLAAKLCINALSLLKRVVYRNPVDGDLYVAGDFGGAQSFDSRWYGAVSEKEILGVYRFVKEWVPGSREGTQDKPPVPARKGSDAASANDCSALTDPGRTREANRELPGTPGETVTW